VNLSPEHDPTDIWPGINFAGHCGAQTYYSDGAVESHLISNCYNIQQDIAYCHEKKKKVLLSIGGWYNPPDDDYSISSIENGINFGEILVKIFGPWQDEYATENPPVPRPFDIDENTHNYVDGFDFDIEFKPGKCARTLS